MTDSPLWRSLQLGQGPIYKVIRFSVILGGISVLLFTGTLNLTWPQQAVLSLFTVLLAIWMDRSSASYLVTLSLVLASVFSTFRYGYWRVSHACGFFLKSRSRWSLLDALFVALLLGAEAYAFMSLMLGYVQTLWPLRRSPLALPDDPELWPEVDVLIPTFDEPLSVVRYTVLAAANMDWPADKLHVYLLDDGRREDFREFAEQAGIGYISKGDNTYAKAGNVNHALGQVNSPFVAIFDCDHVTTRSFLQLSMGWFLREKKLGILQTPQHLYSPDPFERNLGQFRKIPNEGELFYGVVQDGNDLWNATYFCGSCAVLRRSALDDVGGMAVESVTEDAYTSLRMQRRGWNTAYINIPQAAGLAPEGLSGHIRQRIRWARGMVQILRLENPLFASGLNLAQRICYFSAMTHFLYALPRLIFLTAPLIYLLLGRTSIPGYWAAILAYAAPHLVMSTLTNSRIQGRHRFSFWNEIYETVLAPFLLLPTLAAAVHPAASRFSVTAKGGVIPKRFFRSELAQPFLLLITLNGVGLVMAVLRLFHVRVPLLGTAFAPGHPGTILINSGWCCFNILLLGVALAVAWEKEQRRRSVRIPMAVDAVLTFESQALVHGVTVDLSTGGARLEMEHGFTAPCGAPVELTFHVLDERATLPARVVGLDGKVLRAEFDPLTLEQEEALTRVLYSRADAWLGWGEARQPDRPIRSLRLLCGLSLSGLRQTFLEGMIWRKLPVRSKLGTAVLPLLVLVFASGMLRAQSSVWNFPLPVGTVTSDESGASPRAQKGTAPSGTAGNSQSSSSLETAQPRAFQGANDAAQNDLSLLPLPFENAAVQQEGVVSIVFPRPPSLKALKAAGIVASWFGVLAEAHPVRFQVAIGQVPAGNVVLLNESAAELPGALRAVAGFGPTIAIRNNPADPVSKMLLVSGDTADELVVAACALALQRDLIRGDQAHVSSFTLPPARRLDDAPRWLSTEKITRLGDHEGPDLKADGSVLTVHLRFPPDLYYEKTQELVLHLMLGQVAPGSGSEHAIQVSMNGSQVNSLRLTHPEGVLGPVAITVPVPVTEIRPFSNLLAISLGGDAGHAAVVLHDSYVDLRNVPHRAVLPDLQLFSNAGYPFTRRADLAETSVVLPDTPTPDEIATYLSLVGHFGRQTGYPVLRVEVTNAAGMRGGSDRDYLVVGTVGDQSAIRRLGRWLPVMVDGSGLHIQDIQGSFALLQHAWWKVRSSDHVQSRELEPAGDYPDALIEGLEWPRGSNRSVVVVVLGNNAVVPAFLDAFLEKSQSSEISQSVSVLHGGRFVSYRVGNGVYHLGALSGWFKLKLLFSELPWLLVISMMGTCVVLAVLFRAMLRRHARCRLQGTA